MNKSTKITFAISGMQKTSDVLLDDVLNMLRMEKEALEARKHPNNEENNKKKKKKNQRGLKMSYDHNTNMHTLVYTGDEDNYQFDLTTDINKWRHLDNIV